MQRGTSQASPTTPDMAADRTGTSLEEDDEFHSSDLESFQDHGIQKRQARVTVKYNRKELQKRLDLEKWIDESLNRLYTGKEDDMPDEVNIDDLIDLPNDEQRVKNLQAFIRELVGKLEGVHKQEELQSEGIEHPVICHSHYRHEPYHFTNPQHPRNHNQTL